MDAEDKKPITINTVVDAPLSKTWDYWTEPEHIKRWNTASEDWHTTRSENDLKPGGKFSSRMEAKDGSFGFDFWGIYDQVIPHQLIESTMGDGRKLSVSFEMVGNQTHVKETFEPETTNPVDMQRNGWQAILDNFKKYVEAN